jgi:hypothetical protein
MKFYNNYNLTMINCLLQQKLKGHKELASKIINFKLKLELKQIKKEYIEKDFYVWLTYDIVLRNKLTLILNNYTTSIYYNLFESTLNIRSFKDFTINEYMEYYDNLLNKLGLNKQYIRNEPIHICYNLHWWKTTQKNSLPWKQIHECIKLLFFKFTIKIYNKKFKYGTIYEYLLSELEYFPENFRDPTQKEKNIINTRYKANIIYDYPTEQDFYSGLLLVDCKLSIL